MPALSEENVPESDRPKVTLDEFLRLKREIDARTSLTISQLYVIASTAALLIFVLGLAGLYFLGFFWGAIFASVFSSLAVVSMASRMRNSNFRTNFGGRPELKKVARDEQIDDFIDS